MKYKAFLREIRVVPVIIEADSVEQAEEKIREGDGEYLDAEAVGSELDASEHLPNLFEQETIPAE